MNRLIGTIALIFTLAMGTVAAVIVVENVAVASDTIMDEAERERAAALAAKAAGPKLGLRSSVVTTTMIAAPLFAGVDDAALFAQAIDPDTSAATPLFDGVEIWGAAYDRQSETVYMVDGTELVAWPIGGAPALLGTMFAGTTPTTTMNFVGLAFYDGTLYGTRNISSGPSLPEAVYTIDTTTLEATLAFTYSIGANAADIGGFDAHPTTGVLYGTNDDTDVQGLVQLDPDGTVSLIASYPAGQTDIDGLAIGSDNRAYLVTDEPGFFYVFDFDTLTYTTPITSPWTANQLFAGAAWVIEPASPPEIEVRWADNNQLISDGDTTPSTTDGTEFGTVELGQSVIHSFKVFNIGETNLTLGTATLSGCGDFSMVSFPATPVAPGGSRTFSIGFEPTSNGVCTATFSLPNNDSNENPYNFAVRGTGDVPATLPEIEVRWVDNNLLISDGDTTPSTTDGTEFGTLEVGQSEVHFFKVHNTGQTDLTLGTATLSGCGSFSMLSLPASPVAPGASRNFSIEFKPTSNGVCTATFSLPNNDSNENPYNFVIRGSGYAKVPARVFLPQILHLLTCFNGHEQEPNNSPSTATGPLCLPATVTGLPNDENDYYLVQLTQGDNLEINLRGIGDLAPHVQLLLLNNAYILIDDDRIPPYTISKTVGPGTYFVRVVVGEEEQTNNRTYTLEVR